VAFSVFLALGGFLACSDGVSVSEAIETSLSVTPQTVESGSPFGATLTIRNGSGIPLGLVSGASCISFLSVEEAPWGDPVEGTDFGCLTVITEFRFRPGETRVWSWDLVARTSSGQALAPGEYHLEAVLNVSGLEHPIVGFTVLEQG
jgi:hypothetical protein